MKRILFLIVAFVILLTSIVSGQDNTLPDISAPSALLMDYSTGKILFEKNPDEKRALASVTKIMTMLLAMEEIDSGRMSYDDIITASANAKSYGGSTIFLEEGEQMTVRDILKGIAVASGNDAAVAMGEHISGTEELFVAKMNNRAKELGMENTNFLNCNGLDKEGHYSTARDIAIMSRELMKHNDIFEYTTIWMDSLRNGKFTLSNTNKLVKFYNGSTGLKTGSTDDAKFCISATAKRDNMHLIAVIMGAETSKQRQADASSLLNYGFSAYSLDEVIKKDTVVEKLKAEKSMQYFVDVLTDSDFYSMHKKTDETEVSLKKELKKIKVPVKKGDNAGTLNIYENGKQIGSVNLVYASDVQKVNFKFVIKNLLTSWLVTKK